MAVETQAGELATTKTVQPKNPDAPVRKSKIRQKIAGAVGGVLALGTIGAGTAYAVGAFDQQNPATHAEVPSGFAEHLKGDVFDPTAREGVIKPSMIKRLPQEEVNKLDPFARINDHNTVQIGDPIDISPSDNPNAELKFERKNGDSGNEQDRTDRTKEGFLNVLTVYPVPAGAVIKARIRGRLTTFVNENFPINKGYYDSARIDFDLPDGRHFGLLITGNAKKRGSIFNSLTNAPAINGNMPLDQQNAIRNKAILINPNDPILQVAFDEAELDFHLIGNSDPSKGKEVIINGNKVLLVREEGTILELFSIDGKLIQD